MLDCLAAVGYARAGRDARAQSWTYPGVFQLLILVIVLLLAGYSSSPDRAIAQAGHSDNPQAIAGRAPSAAAHILPESLSAALAFNIFIIGDLTQRQATTFGR